MSAPVDDFDLDIRLAETVADEQVDSSVTEFPCITEVPLCGPN